MHFWTKKPKTLSTKTDLNWINIAVSQGEESNFWNFSLFY